MVKKWRRKRRGRGKHMKKVERRTKDKKESKGKEKE